ncbi:MAG: DNA polymerase ligase N-terminal domain-containing protein [Candidatus Nanoarchaeia archaeon]|jgi:bifunctional non-homologous end joining protein LigD|nr:DNA polymerase ligase N-terminal domain-containing protein [Candidatus Nanoarchaeia archaeon]
MSYDKEKLQIGYKGKFVIQHHVATNEHWDLRLEFPVDSLKDALTSYYKKRVWDNDSTTEPETKFPDKSGTVLRSWAIPKHKLPSDKPLLASETEDHDIAYRDFEGTIPEGHYGAGTVDIYDKGTFELVDVDYDKKYVVKFNGKKVDGYYALIKTSAKKFLWIKVKDTSEYKKANTERIIAQIMQPLIERRDYVPGGKDMLEQNAEVLKKKKLLPKELEIFFERRLPKHASIIDYPQETFCPMIWDLKVEPIRLKSEIRKIILDRLSSVLSKFNNYKNWVTDISMTGSMVTNQYVPETDVDINVSIDFDKFRQDNLQSVRHCSNDLEIRQFIRQYVYRLNDKKLVGDHPVKFFVIGKNRRLESDSVYDILKDSWLSSPKFVDTTFVPDEEFAKERQQALSIVRFVLPFIFRTKVHVNDLVYQEKANKDTTDIKAKLTRDFQDLKTLKEEIKEFRLIRFKTNEFELLGCKFSKNWEAFNIIFKYIERYGFKDPIKYLSNLLTNEEKKILSKHELIKIAIIKKCPKKDQDNRPKSEQRWCLYTKDQDRLLGRHPSKEKALQQERVVQIHKHKN